MSNFTDVGRFHRKFGIEHLDGGPPRELPQDLLRFRIGFMIEELTEYCDAAGYTLRTDLEKKDAGDIVGGGPCCRCGYNGQGYYQPESHPCIDGQDLEKAFDSLIDLAYVVLGTAQVHRFPWHEGWNEVQRANMEKERCGLDHRYQQGLEPDLCVHISDNLSGLGGVRCGLPRSKHSLRASPHDIIKPPHWTPPNIGRVLKKWLKIRDQQVKAVRR